MKSLFNKSLLLTLLLSIITIGSSIITISSHAENYRDGVTHINSTELAEKLKDPNSVLIDIRTQAELDRGYIPGAVHVPITELMKDTSLLDPYKDKDLIFYCEAGVRARRLTEFLQKVDHPSKDKLYHLKGDMRAWRARGKKIEKN